MLGPLHNQVYISQNAVAEEFELRIVRNTGLLERFAQVLEHVVFQEELEGAIELELVAMLDN